MKIGFLMILILGAQLIVAPSYGHGEDREEPADKALVEVKKFTSKSGATVHMIIRKDGHLVGKPFIIEARPDCHNAGSSWRKLEVEDMVSACRVKRESLKFDSAKGVIEIEYFDTDADAFNDDSKSTVYPKVPKCDKKVTVFRVSFADLCAPATE